MKILFLQEYIRVNHVLVQDTGTVNIFLKTDLGKKLVQKLKSVGITKQDFYIDYAYAKIPEPKKQVNGKILTYKEPTAQEKKEPQTLLTERIIQEKPDLIVPMGNIGCKYLLNVASIRSLRGIPEKVTLQSEQTGEKFTPWVMPMYSMEYLISSPNVEGMFDADLTTLSRYKTQGDEAFTPAEVSYELVTSLERVQDIFENEVKNYPVIAWDLETNTLLPEMLGAKPLVMSVSWKEGQGVTIPLEHRESHWEAYELEEIYNYIKEFVADKNIVKVGHNI